MTTTFAFTAFPELCTAFDKSLGHSQEDMSFGTGLLQCVYDNLAYVESQSRNTDRMGAARSFVTVYAWALLKVTGSPADLRAIVERAVAAWETDQARLPELRQRAAELVNQSRTAHDALAIIAAIERLLDSTRDGGIREALDLAQEAEETEATRGAAGVRPLKPIG